MTEDERKIAAHMRARVDQCRRLAAALTDKGAAAVLLRMAEEAEADIARLEGSGGDAAIPPPPMAE